MFLFVSGSDKRNTVYITDRVNVLLVCSLRLLLCPYAYEWERGESWVIDRGLVAFPIDTNSGTERTNSGEEGADTGQE